jgi:hypothetical protein
MICFSCGGVAHPCTGAQYSATAIACGPCVRSFWSWARRHTTKLFGGVSFYEHARPTTRRRVAYSVQILPLLGTLRGVGYTWQVAQVEPLVSESLQNKANALTATVPRAKKA